MVQWHELEKDHIKLEIITSQVFWVPCLHLNILGMSPESCIFFFPSLAGDNLNGLTGHACASVGCRVLSGLVVGVYRAAIKSLTVLVRGVPSGSPKL